jgi:hypothetical protein
MQITLADDNTMALAFPYNATTVAFVKLLPNRKWDPVAKQWHVPVADFEAVIGTFPEATVHPDVWAAAYPSRHVQLAEVFAYCRRLNRSGVRLFRDVKLTGKATGKLFIRCEHDFADPDDLKVLERNVNERAAEILALMDAGHRFDIAARAQSVTPVTSTVTEVTTPRTPVREATPLEQAFFNGIQNAKIIAERNETMAARRKAKRFEARQQARLMGLEVE